MAHCNNCQNKGYILKWIFPIGEDFRSFVPALSDKEGKFVNGKLMKLTCIKCNNDNFVEEELYKGSDYSTERENQFKEFVESMLENAPESDENLLK